MTIVTKSTRGSLSRFELGMILAVATLPRLAGLGHVSLWLDEILSLLRVDRGLAGAWEAWRGDPVHPPLSELLQWFWFRVVESEPLRRMLPVVLGIVCIGLLARLADRWFGRRAAWATAWIAAWSPLHVRYSQELRGYSLALLTMVLALAANELAIERKSWGGWAILGLALSLCYWSLYLSVFVLVPIALTVLQATVRCRARGRHLIGFALALVLSVVLFTPWLSVVMRAAVKVHEQQATEWTWSLLGSRWQFLTVGGVEGDSLSAGAILFAISVAIGIVAAVGSSHGRSVIAGAFAGSVGIEVVLRLTDHWSNGRYNLIAWPFLVMLAGLGCARIHGFATRLLAASGRARWRNGSLGGLIVTLPLLAILAFEMAGLADYLRRGRSDWRSVARAVSAMAAPDKPILVSNEWTRLSLGYYLAQFERPPRVGISPRPVVVASGVESAEVVNRGCSVLVAAGWSKSQAIEDLLLETPAQRDFPRSGARVAAVGGGAADPWSCLPPGVEREASERQVPRLLSVFDRRDPRSIEFTAEDRQRLRYGWSYPEHTGGKVTFRWAVGRWAAIDLPEVPTSKLRLEAWALTDDQTLSVYCGRELLATYPMTTTKQTLEVPWPSKAISQGGEILAFGFSRYASPQENPRRLAVAFERVELVP